MKYILFMTVLMMPFKMMTMEAPLMLVKVPIINEITRVISGYAYVPFESNWNRSIYVIEDAVEEEEDAQPVVPANAVKE